MRFILYNMYSVESSASIGLAAAPAEHAGAWTTFHHRMQFTVVRFGTSVVEVLMFAEHKPVDQLGSQRENGFSAARISLRRSF
jgi:hypothetical protein